LAAGSGCGGSDPDPAPTPRPSPSPFLSSTLPGLQLWLKADAITGLTDGMTVATWADSSGNAGDATQATGALQPTYKTGIVNSWPVLRFTGTEYLSSALVAPAGLTTRTVIAVVANVTQNGSGYNHVLHWGNAIPTNSYQSYGLVVKCNGTQTTPYSTNMGNHYTDIGFASNAAPTTGTMLIETSYNGAVDTFYLNGASRGSKSVPLNTTATGLKIGTRADPTDEFLTGDIAEIFIYGPALSDANRAIVENYLAYKYAIY
jgi:hypothetical protein